MDRICGSKSGGKITFGKLLDVCGTESESVDPRFLFSDCKRSLPARFSGLGMDSLVMVVFADA